MTLLLIIIGVISVNWIERVKNLTFKRSNLVSSYMRRVSGFLESDLFPVELFNFAGERYDLYGFSVQRSANP